MTKFTRIASAAALISAMLISPAAAFADYSATVSLPRSGSSLNVREGAGTKYDVVYKLSDGTKITVTDKGDGKWYKIKNASGKVGYASASYIKIKEEISGERYMTVTTKNGGDVNIREKASASSKVKGHVKSGTQVNVLRTEGNWAYAEYEGENGYISLNYLNEGAKMKVKVKSSVNIRAKADSSSKLLGSIANGKTVTAYSVEGKWTKIKYDGVTGYVFSDYLVNL